MAERLSGEHRLLDSNPMSLSPFPMGSKLKGRAEDEYHSMLSIDDTAKVETPSVETDLQNLDLDTEVLDSADFADNSRAQIVDEVEEYVVMDSDDEISGEKEKSLRGHLRRRASTVVQPSLEEYSPAGNGLTKISNIGSGSVHGNTHCHEPHVRILRPEDQITFATHDQEHFNRQFSDGNSHVDKIEIRNLQGDVFVKTQLCSSKCESSNEGHYSSLPNCNHEYACVCQIASQDPEGSSQAHALEFVDHYLTANSANLSPDANIKSVKRAKSPIASSTKGLLNMARKINRRSKVGESIFEWDEMQRDDGGDFFLKKRKELILDCKSLESSSISCPQLAGFLNIQNEKNAAIQFEEKMKGPLVNSVKTYSRRVKKSNLSRKDVQAAKRIIDPYGVYQLNEQTLEPEIGRINRSEPEMLDFGPDTQMAAEAMEALLYAPLPRYDANACEGSKNVLDDTVKCATTNKEIREQVLSPKRARSGLQPTSRNLKWNRPSNNSTNASTSFHKHAEEHKELYLESPVSEKVSSGKSSTKNCLNTRKLVKTKKRVNKISSEIIWGGKEEEDPEKENLNGRDDSLSLSKPGTYHLPWQSQQADENIPPRRRRQWSSVHSLKRGEDPTRNSRGSRNCTEVGVMRRRKRIDSNFSLGMRTKCLKFDSCKSIEATKAIVYQQGEINPDLITTCYLKLDTWTYPKRKRTCQNARYNAKLASSFGVLSMTDSDRAKAILQSSELVHSECVPSAAEENMADVLSVANIKSFPLLNNGENKPPQKRNSSKSLLTKELTRLGFADSLPDFVPKDLRRRKNKANICVLFSHNLDDDIVKRQKKILEKLGISVAPVSSNATHFITDKFVRTRNMLEAIAHGKHVVTHLWLESCAQANCFVDEKNYILRDAKKEKELSFSMPVSLARARKSPLLKDRVVFITPSVKPGIEMIVCLVKAVRGLVVEGIQGAAVDDEMISDLLIISCEEDYEACVPFIEKGAAVYSSEILLNGIIVQKLEYERHQLFKDHGKVKHSTTQKKGG